MIIVLTLGRSGSSVLMQTLRKLGVEVAGRAFDVRPDPTENAEHHRLNPGGYFEEPDIYYGGTSSDTFRDCLVSTTKIACKMDLRHLTDPHQCENWLNAADRISSIFISYREPSEQAHSEFIAFHSPPQRTQQSMFQFTTTFLRRYSRVVDSLEQILETQLNDLAPMVSWIDFKFTSNPAAYVDHISSAAGIEPSRQQIENARRNVDPDLHRIRRVELSANERQWAESLGANAAYRNLTLFHRGDCIVESHQQN